MGGYGMTTMDPNRLPAEDYRYKPSGKVPNTWNAEKQEDKTDAL